VEVVAEAIVGVVGEVIVGVVGEIIVEVLFLRQKIIRRIKMALPTTPATTPPAMVPTLRLEALEEAGALMTVEEVGALKTVEKVGALKTVEEAGALKTVLEGFEEAEALNEAEVEALGIESTEPSAQQTEITSLPQTSEFGSRRQV